MGFLDRARASTLMQAAGIDCLILQTPEAFTYATGAPAGVATMWRRAGAVAAIVPADPSLAEAAVVTDLFARAFRAASPIEDIRVHPIWVETADLRGIDMPDAASAVAVAWEGQGRRPGFERPQTFDAAACFGHVADLLAARGLATARIGVEMADVSALDIEALRIALPNASLVDGGDVLRRLKMIKAPEEIAFLRTACELAEAGVEAMTRRVAFGMSRAELASAWRDGVADAVRERGVANLTGAWEYISVGPDPWSSGGEVRDGALIKVDTGCLVSGYTSDSGRTFVFGEASPVQRDIHAALHAAFDAGMSALRPRALLRDVHAAASRAMSEAGFPGYSRGHFGHGLGASLGSEEWPFISRDAEIAIEPGMVFAFETPLYVDGVGGFIIENQLLVTATGVETMNRLPTGLVRLG